MPKDYYAILGVLPTATTEEIRSAYRKRVKEYHPDHFGQDTTPFLLIQEAYEVLSNPETRSSYDQNLRKSGEKIGINRAEPLIIRSKPRAAEPLRKSPGLIDIDDASPTELFPISSWSFEAMLHTVCRRIDLECQAMVEEFQTLAAEILPTRVQARRVRSADSALPWEATCPICRGRGRLGFLQCRYCAGTGIGSW